MSIELKRGGAGAAGAGFLFSRLLPFAALVCLAMLVTVSSRVRRGQDLGGGVWSVLSILLPRTARLQVRPIHPFPRLPFTLVAPRTPRTALRRFSGACRAGQVRSNGDVEVVSGVGAKGTSRMTLSGGKGLGPDGAQRLADLLREDPPPLLASLELRHLTSSLPHTHAMDVDSHMISVTSDPVIRPSIKRLVCPTERRWMKFDLFIGFIGFNPILKAIVYNDV